MQSFRRYGGGSTRIALLAATVAALLLLLSQRGGPHFSQPAQRAAEDVISPIAQILSVPIRRVETVAFNMKDRNRAFEENLELRQSVADLRSQQSRLALLELKVKRYERILAVRTQAETPLKKIVARAVSETNGPFVRSLLLNAGADDDVFVGNPVLIEDGLIGHVINTGHNSSRVLQLGDLNSRIPVINRRSEGKAILSGDNTARPVLAFVQNATDWNAGDVIITSGDDGMLPMGLPVGVVVMRGEQELRVKLYAENTPIDWVWVSPYHPIEAPSEEAEVEAAPIDEATAISAPTETVKPKVQVTPRAGGTP